MSNKDRGVLDVTVVNLGHGLGTEERAANPGRAQEVDAYLGRLATDDPEVLAVFEAMPHGQAMDPAVAQRMGDLGYQNMQFAEDDDDDRQDRHRTVVFYKADRTETPAHKMFAGRRAATLRLKVGEMVVDAVLAHLRDRTKAAREAAGLEIAHFLAGKEFPLFGGDANAIAADTWQAQALNLPGVQRAAYRLPASTPGERLRQITLPGRLAGFKLGNRVANFGYKVIARVGSLSQRLIEMAERPGLDGPLETLSYLNDMAPVAPHLTTRRLFGRVPLLWRLPIGVGIDHGVVRRGNMRVLHAHTVSSRGLSDHDALFFRVMPLAGRKKHPAARS